MRVRRTSQVHLTMPIALAAALAALFALLGAVIALQGIRVSGEGRAFETSSLAGHLLRDVAPAHLVTDEGTAASPEALPAQPRDAAARAASQQAAAMREGQLLSLKTASSTLDKENVEEAHQAELRRDALIKKEQEEAAYEELLKQAKSAAASMAAGAAMGQAMGGHMGAMMGAMAGGAMMMPPPASMPMMAPPPGAPLPTGTTGYVPPPGGTMYPMAGTPTMGTPYPAMPGVTVYQGAPPMGSHFADQASMEAAARAAGKTPAELGYFTGPLPPGTVVMPGPGMPGAPVSDPFAGMTPDQIQAMASQKGMTVDQMKSMTLASPTGPGPSYPGGPGVPFPPHPMMGHPMEWDDSQFAKGIIDGFEDFEVTKDSNVEELTPEERVAYYYQFHTDEGQSEGDRLAQIYDVGDRATLAELDEMYRREMMPSYMPMVFGGPFGMAWGDHEEDEEEEDEEEGDEEGLSSVFIECAEAGLDAMRAAAGDFRLAKSNMPEKCLGLVKDERVGGDDFCLQVRLSAALEAGEGAKKKDINAILSSKRYGASECIEDEHEPKGYASGRSCIDLFLDTVIDTDGDVRAAVQEIAGESEACDAYFADYYLAPELQPVGLFALRVLARVGLEEGNISGVNDFLARRGWSEFISFDGPPDYFWSSTLVEPQRGEEVTLEGTVVVDEATGSVYLWSNDQYIPLVTSTDIDLDDHRDALVQVTGFGDLETYTLDVTHIESLQVAEAPEVEEVEVVEEDVEGLVKGSTLATLSKVVTRLIEDSTAIIEDNAGTKDAQAQHEVAVAQEALVAAKVALGDLADLVTLDTVEPASVIPIVLELLPHEEAVAEITGEQHATAPEGPAPTVILEEAIAPVVEDMIPRIVAVTAESDASDAFKTAVVDHYEGIVAEYEEAVDACGADSPDCVVAIGKINAAMDDMKDYFMGYLIEENPEVGMTLGPEVEEIVSEYDEIIGQFDDKYEGGHEGERYEAHYQGAIAVCVDGQEAQISDDGACLPVSYYEERAVVICGSEENFDFLQFVDPCELGGGGAVPGVEEPARYASATVWCGTSGTQADVKTLLEVGDSFLACLTEGEWWEKAAAHCAQACSPTVAGQCGFEVRDIEVHDQCPYLIY